MNVRYIIFYSFILIGLCGCSYKVPNLEDVLSDNKSIVILPILEESGAKIHWRRAGDTEKKKDIFTESNSFAKVGYEYLVIPVEPGIYYINDVFVKHFYVDFEKKFPLSYTAEYISAFGNVALEKTPEKYEYEVYSRGRSRTVTEDITSYYQFSYLADINNTVGTITVNPNEIILIPAVNIDIELAYNSCKPVNLKEDGFLDKFFGSSHNSIIGALWDASTTENGFYTWTWSCPVKTFTIDIKTTLLSDFTIYTEAYTMSVKPQSFFALSAQRGFPIDLRERIVVRDFELGKMFKNAKKLKTLDDGTEQYIIYGNADEEQKDQIKAIKLFLALLCSITFTNANFGINNSNYQQKETVLTSITGGSVNIEVGGNTNLKGSLMLQEKDTLATTGNCIMFSLSSKNGEINVNV